MDERKNTIRELEIEKTENTNEKKALLEGLGETLLLRVGDEAPFSEGDEANLLLNEYHDLLNENARFKDTINSLEEAIQRFKELDELISGKQEDYSLLTKKLVEVHTVFGRDLFALDSGEIEGQTRLRIMNLLAKVEEYEGRLEALEDQEGGILTWLGKSAQKAVSKTMLLKNRSALQRSYREIGEKFCPDGNGDGLEGEAATLAEEVFGARKLLSLLGEELSVLKGERGRIVDQYGSKGAPSRSIATLEKRIIQNCARLLGVYLRFGALACGSTETDPIAMFIKPEDRPVLEKIETLKAWIAEEELEISRIKAAISIDNDKAEIDKAQRAIVNQRHKISAAEETIADLEKQISEMERHIEELKEFLSASAKSGNETPSS